MFSFEDLERIHEIEQMFPVPKTKDEWLNATELLAENREHMLLNREVSKFVALNVDPKSVVYNQYKKGLRTLLEVAEEILISRALEG